MNLETTHLPPIESLIPHRQPMLLLQRPTHLSEEYVVAEVSIGPQSRYYSAELDGVPAWVGIEYMAQTISMWSGHCQTLQDLPVRIGFLLGTQRYRCDAPAFENGQQLWITAKPCYLEDSGLSSFDCQIEVVNQDISGTDASTNNCEPPDTTQIASARINAFEPEDPKMLFQPRNI